MHLVEFLIILQVCREGRGVGETIGGFLQQCIRGLHNDQHQSSRLLVEGGDQLIKPSGLIAAAADPESAFR